MDSVCTDRKLIFKGMSKFAMGGETVSAGSSCPGEYFKDKPVDVRCSRAGGRRQGASGGSENIKMNELTNEWVPGRREER